MGWLAGWLYRRKLTIDPAKVDSDLTNLPVLVKLTSANFDFTKAQSDGADIRFTSSDGTTLLDYEFERYDSTGQKAEIWVRVPSVSSTADTEFYIYYGKSDATDSQNPTGVWPTTEYVMVQHLEEESGSGNFLEDETANNCDGAPTNASFLSEAQIDGGRDCVGNSQSRVEFPHNAAMAVETFTVEVLSKVESITSPDHNPICYKGNQIGWGGDQYMFRIKIDSTTSWGVGVCAGGAERYANFTESGLTGSYTVWALVHVSGSAVRGYRNGAYKGEQASSGTVEKAPAYPVRAGWGYRSTGSEQVHCDEKATEIRIHKVERSAAWLKASYNAQMDTLLTHGSEETNIVLNYHLSGGATNTDPDASLGGHISTTQVTDDSLNNLFDDITETECEAGDTEYRAIFIKNDGTGTALGVRVWIAAQPDSDRTFKEEVHIGIEAPVNDAIQTIPDESTAPSGVTFSQPAGEADGLLIGDLAPGECYGIWIRRGPFPAETITHVSPASFQVQSKYQASAFTLKYNVLKAIYYVSVVVVKDRTQVLDVTEACPALILSKWGTRWTFPDFVRSPAYDVVDPPPSWPSTVTKQMEQVYDKTIVNFPWVNISPWQESRDQGLLVSKWGSGARLTNLRYEISGVTRDQNGQPLGYCTVQLIARDTLIVAQETESDGNGNYAFYVPDPDQEYFVRAFKAGAPDRWGTTEHTLKGEAT